MAVAFGADYEELVFPPVADHRIQSRVLADVATRTVCGTFQTVPYVFLFLLAVLDWPFCLAP